MPKFHADAVKGDIVYMTYENEFLLGEGEIKSFDGPMVDITGIGALREMHWETADLILMTTELRYCDPEEYFLPKNAENKTDWASGYWVIKLTQAD